MAVYLTDSLQPADEMNIGNYLWLTSDLTGTIESQQYYFSTNTPEVHEAMDNLMLTHGWRRFKWEDIQERNKPVLKFLPEYNGHIVTGRVVKTGSNLPEKDIPVYFSVVGKRLQLHTALSDTNGKVMFNNKDFYNEGEIIVQANSQKDSLYSVEIDNPFSSGYANRPLPIFSLQQLKKPELEKRHAALQIQAVYNNQKFNQYNTLIDSSAFFFKPDITYLLDNYVRFTTMEEVMIEYVREVKVKKINGNYRFSVYNINQQLFFDEDPLLLLNGVPVFNGNKLMSYNPLNIEKLEVIERMYHFENMLFSGIVNMVTYGGNLSEYELDPNATVIDYEGLQLQRKFFSPVYESKEQYETRLPDYRNVLYWAPDIIINETGKKEISFYCSDLPGNYVIVLQGLSENGKTGSQTLQFQVKK
ncbi:MAG: hypothetical protein IPK31_16560 [Chitinophagaceae bacterium]|nr:hypothetical protein [Chitinophagaceae bacterium]